MASRELQSEREEKGGLSTFASFLIMIAIVVVAYFGLRTFVVGTYEIPSGSMLDTIQIGDRVFSEKVSYYFRDPEQGDIITFAREPSAHADQARHRRWRADRRLKGRLRVCGRQEAERTVYGGQAEPSA